LTQIDNDFTIETGKVLVQALNSGVQPSSRRAKMHNDVTLRVAKEDGRHLVASFLDIWMCSIQERSVISVVCQAARVTHPRFSWDLFWI
jgi:hypothetical protein